MFTNGKCFRKSQFSIKLNPRYVPKKKGAASKDNTKDPAPKSTTSKTDKQQTKDTLPQADEQFQQIADETNFDSVSFQPHHFNFDSFVKRNMAPQTFPDPAIFKSATQIADEKKKKKKNRSLMSDEDYPAQSFTFVQPQRHENVTQGSVSQPLQSSLPSFAATFGPEEPSVNPESVGDAAEGQQPAESQPADADSETTSDLRTLAEQSKVERDMRLSPNKRFLARATAEQDQEIQNDQQVEPSDDQSSATSLASGGPREMSTTLEAAMPPITKKRRHREPKVVEPTAASSRPERERKVPERLGKVFVHNVEGLDLAVERQNDSSDSDKTEN